MSADGLILVLDDPRIAVDREELALNDGMITVAGTDSDVSVDWGDAAIDAAMSQDGEYGNSVADRDIGNRTITIPLVIGAQGDTSDDSKAEAEAALRNLSMKLSLIQDEGGWLCRQRAGGDPMYADIENATLNVPDTWLETLGVESGIALTLETKPDFYGDEIELDAIACTGYCSAVATLNGEPAVIQGDYAGRVRIRVYDTSGNAQNGLLWGVQSRYYDDADTAFLQYEAEDLLTTNGSASATLTGASGGHVVKLAVPAAATWEPMLVLQLADGTALTHHGRYRVVIRAYSATEEAQFQLQWANSSSSAPTTNSAVALPGTSNFYLLDLGIIGIETPPVGFNAWLGVISAQVATSDHDAQIDEVFLIPLDEAAGTLNASTLTSPPTITTVAESSPAGSSLSGSGAPWTASGSAWSTGPIGNEEHHPQSLNGGISGPPGAWAESGFGNPWTQDSAASYQSNVGGFLGGTQELELTDWGFSIPSDAVITGVEATIVAIGPAGVSTGLILTGADTTTVLGAAGSGEFTLGGDGQLWGSTTLTPAVVNASGFGIQAAAGFSGSEGSYNFGILNLTVYYYITEESQSNVLRLTDFGFAVPAGAVIVSLTAALNVTGNGEVDDETIQLTNSGSVLGNNVALGEVWGNGIATYGGWGVALTRAIVNSTTFGLDIQVQPSGETDPASVTINSVTLTCTYSMAAVILSQDATIFPNLPIELRTDGMWRTADGAVYDEAANELGTAPRLPRSGMEQRPARLFVKPLRGHWNGTTGASGEDNALDTFTVQPVYRPCYLTRI